MSPFSDQGLNKSRYRTIPRTLIFLFDHNHRVLLLKGSSHKKLWAGLYNGIGGHIEAGEDILEAAQRELVEETGIKGVALDLCGQIMIDVNENPGIALFIFKGKFRGGFKKESQEGELAWVDLYQLDNIPVVEDLPILLPKVVSHRIGDKVFIGKYYYNQENGLEISIH